MLINVMVTPGDVQDRDAIAPLLEIASNRFATLKKAIADGAYQGQRTAEAVQQKAGIPLEIVKRSDIARGFHILPKRWIVERTYGWLGLPPTCETLRPQPCGFIIPAMICLMLHRIVRQAAAS